MSQVDEREEITSTAPAHIVGDLEEKGLPVVSNGFSPCTIHHRGFDRDPVGISPDNEVRDALRLLRDRTS